MVLGELGAQISGALRRLQNASTVDEEAINMCLKEVTTALLTSDVNIHIVTKLRDMVKKTIQIHGDDGTNKRKLVQKSIVTELQRMLDPEVTPFKPQKGKRNVIMFVGLQGAGKTTSCGKFAHWYHKKGWKVALVCADTFRAGAFDQLKQIATRAKIPFYGSYTETDPVVLAKQGVDTFDQYDMVIVDTSGRHMQETALFTEMQQVASSIQPDEIIFTVDSSIGQSCFDQAKAFRKSVNVGSVIVTKLDGHAKGGGALSAVAATESPIIFLGTGEHLEDLEPFQAQSFIKRLLGLGDIDTLFSKVQEAVPLDKQPELIQRIGQGQFTLRDMYEQFQAVLKLGPLNQVMSCIPGIQQQLLEKINTKEGANRIKAFMCIMDSMTNDELDCVKQMNPSRCQRVARGSGTSVREVNLLLDEYKKFAKMVEKLGKMKLGQGNELSQMMRNPNQITRKLQNAVDPRMLKQLGGTQNVMQMMKEMGKMENMQEMMQAFKKAGGAKRR